MDVLKKLRLPAEKLIVELDLSFPRTKEAVAWFEAFKKKQEELNRKEYKKKNG